MKREATGRFFGQSWGGEFLTYGGAFRADNGKPVIYCEPTNGSRPFCITISRWDDERIANRIVPVVESAVQA